MEILIISSCGSKYPKVLDENGHIVEELAVPNMPSVIDTENGRMLEWQPVKNAYGYNVFKGSSKYASDFTQINEKAIKDTFYAVDSDYSYYKITAVNGDVESEESKAASYENTIFGDNVYIYSPSDDPELVNEELHKIYLRQETNQFGKARYQIMFKPGEYSDVIKTEVGFYMDVCGLGITPEETVLNNLNCSATWLGDDSNHNATCNFWRGVSNLSVNSNVLWAVSQATFMRRMNINGNLILHDNHGWASGGFLADSRISGTIDSGSQQQWLTRNSYFSKWTGENWNIVFVGDDEKTVPQIGWPSASYTAVNNTPVIKEKPFLVYDNNEYYVCTTNVKDNSVSYSWGQDDEYNLIPITDFYVAKAEEDNHLSINQALEEGKNVLFTPGIYKLDEEISVCDTNRILIGTGYATLIPQNGNACIKVNCSTGVTVAGLLFDAGNVLSKTLLTVGDKANKADSDNPILLSDVFFRVGGATSDSTSVDACVEINADYVIGDNFWVWRADHGEGVAWNKNPAENGIIVNGDNVTVYALMVEHFRQYQTVWNGENGSVYFYQSELPYDVPNQKEWLSHSGEMHGYASYYVDDSVKKHTAYGIGIYSYNRDAIVEEYTAMEVPECDGMNIHNVCAVMITGNPGISHVINKYGKPCYRPGTRNIIIDFQKERNPQAD